LKEVREQVTGGSAVCTEGTELQRQRGRQVTGMFKEVRKPVRLTQRRDIDQIEFYKACSGCSLEIRQ
jgi:hypothetical protein